MHGGRTDLRLPWVTAARVGSFSAEVALGLMGRGRLVQWPAVHDDLVADPGYGPSRRPLVWWPRRDRRDGISPSSVNGRVSRSRAIDGCRPGSAVLKSWCGRAAC